MTPDATERGIPPLLTRVLGAVIIALMALATAYTGWIALANWHRIGV